MPFFVNPKTKKRKFQQQGKSSKVKKNTKALSEEVSSDSEVDSNEATESRAKLYSSDEDEEETPQQKRLRLAKEYLSQLEDEETEKADDDRPIKDVVSDRLQHDISEQAGKQIKEIADLCSCPSLEELRIFRGHKLSVTTTIISPDDKYIFTASKDCNICKWDVQTGLKVKTIKGGRKGTEETHIGHTDHILCMSMSSDGKFLAAGDLNNMIKLWNPDDCSFIHKFKGHRGAVTGVSFRSGSHMLYSCSVDKSVKVWSVDDLAYVETLYGHNAPITGISSLARERAVTSGGRDRSIHIWKIPEDSQLLFYGHEGSIECVSLINEGNFFSGADDSSLCVWSVLKKKPLVTKHRAHGLENGLKSENWISAVAAHQYSDLVASGSKDGFVRLWKCSNGFKTLEPLFTVPVKGFVNSLCFSNNGDFLIAGVGQEHRLGRWWSLKDAKNGWVIIPLKTKDQSGKESSEEDSEEEMKVSDDKVDKGKEESDMENDEEDDSDDESDEEDDSVITFKPSKKEDHAKSGEENDEEDESDDESEEEDDSDEEDDSVITFKAGKKEDQAESDDEDSDDESEEEDDSVITFKAGKNEDQAESCTKNEEQAKSDEEKDEEGSDEEKDEEEGSGEENDEEGSDEEKDEEEGSDDESDDENDDEEDDSVITFKQK